MEEPGVARLPAPMHKAETLIARAYLAALAALFGGAVGKDTVSRTWRKVKGDWDAWKSRSLAGERIVRLIHDGTVVRVRLDRKAIAISLLVVIGVRADGQKVLLAVKSAGSESTEAWRAVLDDHIKRGLRRGLRTKSRLARRYRLVHFPLIPANIDALVVAFCETTRVEDALWRTR